MQPQPPPVRPQGKVRVVIVAAHDSLGGAARAIYRVFLALREWQSDLFEVILRTPNKTVNDDQVVGGKPVRNRREFFEYWIRTRYRKYFPRNTFVTDNPILHSQALYDTGLGREINSLEPDVVIMGWLGNSTISIREIGRIRAPIVWRMSDLWLVAGAEHVTDTQRYEKGYSRRSRPVGESGPDINRETFLRKKRNWRKKSWIVALSKWQARQAELSDLTKEWPVNVIPVPIDPDIWYPIDQKEARKKLGLPQEPLLIGFGAGEATRHRHKGADLLFSALDSVEFRDSRYKDSNSVELVIFGEEKDTFQATPIPANFLGKLSNNELRCVYSALDVLVVPSRQEPFGQVAAEAQTCGAPIVVFDNSGLADVAEDFVTGRIVPAFDTSALGEAIAWLLSNEEWRCELKKAARDRAIRLWHPRVVAEQYAEVLRKAAESAR